MQVAVDDEQIAEDSDYPDQFDKEKTWVQTLEDGHGRVFKVRGKKRCTICRRREGLMRRCDSCRHHVHGTLHGAIPESMGGSCFLITKDGEFMCRGTTCGLSVPRVRIAFTSAEIQAALHKKGVVAAGDMFPEACLAPAQVVQLGQQRHVPICGARSCRSLRVAKCQHFQCEQWFCNKHCSKILMEDGRPIAVWCLQHENIPVIRSAPIGEQFMNPDHVPACGFCGTYHEVVGCNYEGCSLGWCPSHGIYVSGVGGGF
eukprot:806987-Amphidinium_carterae.1